MITGNQEIEVRFPDIDKPKLIKRLQDLGAADGGEGLLEEAVFQSTDGT